MNLTSVSRFTDHSRGLLVLLHGLGSNEQDLFDLGQYIPEDWDIVSFRAPFSYGPGYAWFDIEWTASGIEIDVEQREKSLRALSAEINRLPRGGKKMVVGGFSQGSIMTMSLLCEEPTLMDAAMVWSGRWPQYTEPATTLNALPCLVQHGTLDDVLPVTGGREIKEKLVGWGAAVEYHEYQMGHTISAESLADSLNWLSRLLG